MIKPKKNIKKLLANGNPTVGTWMQIPDTSVAEIMGSAGYDWVALDLEHGLFSNQQLADLCRAIELGGSVPMARIARNHPKDIKHALEAGARGIICPMIETGEQVAALIDAAYYPPRGNRGVGFSRANLFGKRFDNSTEKHNESVVIVAQIEHIQAVENLESILEQEHLDAIMIGPYDLSASMGLTGQFEHAEFIAVLERIKEITLKTEVALGAHVVQPDPEKLKIKISEGYRWIAYGVDAIFLISSVDCPDF